jgi:hypothetical protein
MTLYLAGLARLWQRELHNLHSFPGASQQRESRLARLPQPQVEFSEKRKLKESLREGILQTGNGTEERLND